MKNVASQNNAADAKPDVISRDEIRRVLGFIGSIKTEKKPRQSALNGQKGGRPLLDLSAYDCSCGKGDVIEGPPTTCPRGRAIRRRRLAGKL